MIRVKNLITVHHRHQIFSLGKVDDVVRISWQHVNALDVITADFKLYHFISTYLSFLNQPWPATTIKNSHLVLCQCCPLVIPGLLILMEI